MIQKLKEFTERYRKELIFGAVIFLVSAFSFALGYVTARDANRTPIIIRTSAPEAASSAE